ncbi:MAG TPA: hypothetical protein VGP93_00260 [Polyangiaceae bacterium]|nr:hypothetical protein [Polyangiaceae bacterium]
MGTLSYWSQLALQLCTTLAEHFWATVWQLASHRARSVGSEGAGGASAGADFVSALGSLGGASVGDGLVSVLVAGASPEAAPSGAWAGPFAAQLALPRAAEINQNPSLVIASF